MREYKILVVEEDEMPFKAKHERPFSSANHVVVRKNDGTCETIKDRWDYSGNLRKVEIYLPARHSTYEDIRPPTSLPHRTSLKFKEIQCVSVKNTSVTQTDCLMFGLDEYGQMWEKRLQDSTWTRTPMKVEE